MNPRVLITGCGLTVSEDFRIWGDLWIVGECYVFNACGPEEGLPEPFAESQRQLIIHAPTVEDAFFERRNVFVVARGNATLNQAARDYLAKEPT
jgi:hypothetical protein